MTFAPRLPVQEKIVKMGRFSTNFSSVSQLYTVIGETLRLKICFFFKNKLSQIEKCFNLGESLENRKF